MVHPGILFVYVAPWIGEANCCSLTGQAGWRGVYCYEIKNLLPPCCANECRRVWLSFPRYGVELLLYVAREDWVLAELRSTCVPINFCMYVQYIMVGDGSRGNGCDDMSMNPDSKVEK
jgi:hypothetical protein